VFSVPHTSKSAVSQVSKPADRRQTWKSAAQQVWKPALQKIGRQALNEYEYFAPSLGEDLGEILPLAQRARLA
jgi:hypothetical protein